LALALWFFTSFVVYLVIFVTDYRESWDITTEEGSLCFASAIYSRLVGGEQDESELLWLAEYLRVNSTALAQPEAEIEPAAYIHRQGNYTEVSEMSLSGDEKARGWTEEPLFHHPLAQPEPEGVTDEELLRTYGKAKREYRYDGPIDDWPRREERAATVHGLRAVIAADRAHYTRPAIKPVPVAEPVPVEDCDGDGNCWWFCPAAILPNGQCAYWCLAPADGARSWFTHWLPARAMPLPQQPS
jgi:hypothetical protein